MLHLYVGFLDDLPCNHELEQVAIKYHDYNLSNLLQAALKLPRSTTVWAPRFELEKVQKLATFRTCCVGSCQLPIGFCRDDNRYISSLSILENANEEGCSRYGLHYGVRDPLSGVIYPHEWKRGTKSCNGLPWMDTSISLSKSMAVTLRVCSQTLPRHMLLSKPAKLLATLALERELCENGGGPKLWTTHYSQGVHVLSYPKAQRLKTKIKSNVGPIKKSRARGHNLKSTRTACGWEQHKASSLSLHLSKNSPRSTT